MLICRAGNGLGCARTIACPCNIHGVHGGQIVHPVEAGPCLLIPASYEQVCGVWALLHSNKVGSQCVTRYARASVCLFSLQQQLYSMRSSPTGIGVVSTASILPQVLISTTQASRGWHAFLRAVASSFRVKLATARVDSFLSFLRA